MKRDKQAWMLIAGMLVSWAALLTVSSGLWQAQAQNRPAQPSAAGAGSQPPLDELQRSNRIDSYWLVAKDGAARGETLYFYKCWTCHNQYTIQAQYGDKAPFLRLQDLYQRPKLNSGQPVSDAAVIEQIKNGSGGMPSFRTNMPDADIADLVSYLKSGRCCVEGDNPPSNPWYVAEKQKWPVQTATKGGARGMVQIPTGESPEGIMVQLIAQNNVRTTVYAQEDGSFEFPAMQAGSYTLRIAKPLEYKPYRRDGVRIDGATRLPNIALERVTKSEDLPATPAILSQLSGSEMLWNLPGTNFEKQVFNSGCGCHSYQQTFRNRFDERSWRVIVNRMTHYSGATLINPGQGRVEDGAKEEVLVKWLTRVRGPDSVDMPVQPFPRPRGSSTRVVITEYELPRVLISPHDVHGDSQGNIWYSSHKTPYVGKLDPKTGIITEYKVPLIPGALPGTHRVWVE